MKSTHKKPSTIALDWGSSSLRAWLLDDNHQVLDYKRNHRGMIALSNEDANKRKLAFEQSLVSLCGDWLAENPEIPLIACGMVGAKTGWFEAKYIDLPCPVFMDASQLLVFHYKNHSVSIVPGLRLPKRSEYDFSDVMRGEETQMMGMIGQLEAQGEAAEDYLLILPGTHSKWVRIHHDEVIEFATLMTGELYQLLLEHSLLGKPITHAETDLASFDLGVSCAMQHQNQALTHLIFSARTQLLDGSISAPQIADYLSGILIGNEMVTQLQKYSNIRALRIALCGDDKLTQRYARVLDRYHLPYRLFSPITTLLGLMRFADKKTVMTQGGTI